MTLTRSPTHWWFSVVIHIWFFQWQFTGPLEYGALHSNQNNTTSGRGGPSKRAQFIWCCHGHTHAPTHPASFCPPWQNGKNISDIDQTMRNVIDPVRTWLAAREHTSRPWDKSKCDFERPELSSSFRPRFRYGYQGTISIIQFRQNWLQRGEKNRSDLTAWYISG